MKKRLRDFLQNLLKGSSSPQKLKLTYAVLQYIKEHSSDLGIRYKIHLELDESIVIYSDEVAMPKFRINGFDDYSGKYRIVDELIEECNKETYQKELYSFISKEETDMFLLLKPRIINDVRIDLFKNVLRDNNLTEYDVFNSREVIYDNNYKMDFLTFRKKISDLHHGEIKYQYYKYFLLNEFVALKYELEKYSDANEHKKHLEIMEFYNIQFIKLIDEYEDTYIRKCYSLISHELENTIQHVLNYFEPSKDNYHGKLVWNGNYIEFKKFFNPLIRKDGITYDGEINKYAIYEYLLDKIHIGKRETEINIKYIVTDLKIPRKIPKMKIDKLFWAGTRDEFAAEFMHKINFLYPSKSKFVFNGRSSIKLIAKKLHELFDIEDQKNPEKKIDEGSLYTAFKNVSRYRRKIKS